MILQIGESVRIDPWIPGHQRDHTGTSMYLKYSTELHPTKVIMDQFGSASGSLNTVRISVHICWMINSYYISQ